MLHAEERPEHVGVEGGGIGIGGRLRHWTGLAFGAGVVDRYVQATEARKVPSTRFRTSSSWRTSVRKNSASVPSARSSVTSFWPASLVATGNNGAVTFPRESPGRRTPDSS